jgi:hypothetical protein
VVKEALPAAAAGKPIEIWFQDEARVGQKGSLECVWARLAEGSVRRSRMEWQAEGAVGSRPRAVRDHRHASASLFGALCPSRAVGAAVIMPAANSEALSAHLAEIATQLAPGAHAILLCDGAGWHQRGGRLRVPDTITSLPIPPYTPVLVWGLRCQAEKCWSVAYPSW